MPQPCKICKHANRQAIDAALVEGYPALRAIGERYGVSKDALHRHRAAHLDGDQAEAQQANNGAADSVLKHRKTIEPDEPRSATEPTETEPILNNQNHSNEPDVEAHYLAFLDRWRGLLGVTRDQMREWEYEQTEEIEGLLDEALRRGDLWQIGQFYGQTLKTIARFSGRA